MIRQKFNFKTFSLVYLFTIILISLLTVAIVYASSTKKVVYEGNGGMIEACEYSPGIYAVEVDYDSDCEGIIQVTPEGERNLWSVDHSVAYMRDYANHAKSLFRVDQDGGRISVSIYPVQEDLKFSLERVVIVRKRLASATYSALRILFAALILYAIAAFVYSALNKAMDRNKKLLFMGIFLLWFVSMFGFMEGYLPGGHDVDFHLTRIAGLADGIRSCHFPVRIYMDYVNDYGYPLGIMYGDLFLYPSAILHILGLPLWQCYVFYVGYISLMTAIISCYAFTQMTENTNIGFIGSALYTLSAWRLNDVYIRAAAGEYAAMAFLPLIVLGFFNVFSSDGKEKDRKAFIYLVIGYFGVIQTHMLSSVIITVFLVVLGLIMIKRILSRSKIFLIIKSAVAAFLVNLAFIVPLLDYYMSHDLIVEDQDIRIQTHGAYWSQLFSTRGNMLRGSMTVADSIGICDDMPFGMGLGLLFVLFGVLIVLLVDRECRYRLVLGICGVVAVVSLFMSTCYFPYDFIAGNLTFVGRIIGSVQFPWRYLVIVTLSLTIAAVFLLKYLWEKNRQHFVLITSLLLVLHVTMAFGFISDRISQIDTCITAMNSDQIASPMISTDTMYWIQGMSRDDISDREIFTSGEDVTAVMTSCKMPSCDIAFSKSGGAADGKSFIEPPILNYKGYHAYCDGVELTVSDGDNYRIRVELPDREEGVIHISFKEPVLWRISELISILSLILIVIYCFLENRKKKNCV